MPASKLRILCFGDSLTEGYSAWGTRFTPYSTKLGDMLRMAFPDVEVEIVTDGRSGDLVVEDKGNFLYRFRRHCKLSLACLPFLLIRHPKEKNEMFCIEKYYARRIALLTLCVFFSSVIKSRPQESSRLQTVRLGHHPRRNQ